MRGTIGERPWGWTLGALGESRRTVQVVLRSDGKEYRITFDHGEVVAATSPMAVDAVTRVALTNHMIAAIQVNEIKRCLAAAPSLDEVDVLAAAAHLDVDTAHKLRRRLLVQRAARTFAVDSGDFEITDCEPMASAFVRVDIRAVIFFGARMNLSEDRLRFGLRHVGSKFVLKPAVVQDLEHFDFTPKEQPLLYTLRSPTSIAELEANHREIDPRGVQAVVYALASCGALAELDLELSGPTVKVAPEELELELELPVPPPQPPPPVPLVLPLPAPPLERVERSKRGSEVNTFDEPSMAQGTPGIDSTFEGPLTRTIASLELEELSRHPPEAFDEPATMLRTTPSALHRSAVPMPIEHSEETVRGRTDRALIETFKTGRVTTMRPNALKAHEVVALIEERSAMVARGADHFTLLGVPVNAPIEDIHAAYVELQRNLSAKRLRELGIADSGLVAEQLLAQVGIAFTVLTDRIRRNEYLATLRARAERRTR